MRCRRRFKVLAVGVGTALALAAAPAIAAAAPSPSVRPLAVPAVGPQNLAAREGAQWLAAQVDAQGFVATTTAPAQPELGFTAQVPLALAAANVAPAVSQRVLSYLAGHVEAYVTAGGSDGPGQLALLILDAHALGADPDDFGGTDLVSRLLATEQTTGTDAGLFGTQTPAYNGTYRQGLSLAALAAVGDTGGPGLSAAVSWLEAQQCPDGGWSSLEAAQGCTVDPGTYLGPDTNSTALALEGLAAQGAVSPAVSAAALGFLAGAQDPDGGWSYYPDTATVPGVSDPDSTSLVVQALLSLGVSPTSEPFSKAAGDPVSYIESQQLTSGPGSGAFVFPVAAGGSGTADVLATYQAVPALAGVAIPFGPSGGSFWLAGSDGGVFGLGQAGYFGSLPALGVHVDDITALMPSSDGKGYWLVGSDGGVYAFGDAGFFGSVPGLGVGVHDVVGAAATPDGGGYWLVGSDGGVYAFGDAAYHGSLPGLGIGVHDVVGASATPDGGGYLLAGSNGGAFAFGDAAYSGSLPGLGVGVHDVVGSAFTPDGAGYVLAGADGGVFAFGAATFPASLASGPLAAPIVAVAASPARSTG